MTQNTRDAGERLPLRGGWYFERLKSNPTVWRLYSPDGGSFGGLWYGVDALAFAAAQLAPGTKDEGLEIAADICARPDTPSDGENF